MAASTFEKRFADHRVSRELDLFGRDISYTPFGGIAKTIKAIVLSEGQNSHLGSGNALETYDTMEIQISSRNNTEGQVTVKEYRRDTNAGDSLSIDGVTWYVRNALENDVAGMHKLLISTTLLPFIDQ